MTQNLIWTAKIIEGTLLAILGIALFTLVVVIMVSTLGELAAFLLIVIFVLVISQFGTTY